MGLSDIKEIMDIEKKCFPSPWPERAFREELARPWSRSIVIEDKKIKRIIGYSIMWYIYDECHLLNIAINPEYQGRGFGKLLMGTIVRYSKKMGASYILLEVRRSNIRAINLYKSFGFKIVGIRPRYYSDNNEDAFEMVLNLKE